ncbi:unnamed protein product [Prorocentrum cordatum]|uniref:Phosphodiester glycosidase domain-containing protein n=1 Tax=Prorocentrum cordatum TaxID=2364126 RepID=A0ABN9RUI9_9DINO|nr:unnamed protein product [Polarella glacialis]
MNELADKMISFGAVEAINLDGGGSTQMWKNGVQIGYSSDRNTYGVLAGTYEPGCPIGEGKGNLSAFECARKISTIICIHEANSGLTSFLASPRTQAGSQVSALSLGTLVVGLCLGAAIGAVASKMWSKKEGKGVDLNGDDSVKRGSSTSSRAKTMLQSAMGESTGLQQACSSKAQEMTVLSLPPSVFQVSVRFCTMLHHRSCLVTLCKATAATACGLFLLTQCRQPWNFVALRRLAAARRVVACLQAASHLARL